MTTISTGGSGRRDGLRGPSERGRLGPLPPAPTARRRRAAATWACATWSTGPWRYLSAHWRPCPRCRPPVPRELERRLSDPASRAAAFATV